MKRLSFNAVLALAVAAAVVHVGAQSSGRQAPLKSVKAVTNAQPASKATIDSLVASMTPGRRTFMVGASSRDIKRRADVQVKKPTT